jgi:hypothetical protein
MLWSELSSGMAFYERRGMLGRILPSTGGVRLHLRCIPPLSTAQLGTSCSNLFLAFKKKCKIIYIFFICKVVKSGIKYGTDFVLYRKGPAHYHAEWSVVVMRVEQPAAGGTEEGSAGRQLSWRSLSTLNRLSEQVAKVPLLSPVVLWLHCCSVLCLTITWFRVCFCATWKQTGKASVVGWSTTRSIGAGYRLTAESEHLQSQQSLANTFPVHDCQFVIHNMLNRLFFIYLFFYSFPYPVCINQTGENEHL